MKIGYGILLPKKEFNFVRDKEILLAQLTGSDAGLLQPPHITIKRPFDIKDESLDLYKKYVQQIPVKLKSFKIQFEKFDSFGESTIILKTEQKRELFEINKQILTDLSDLAVVPELHDGTQMVFHTTIAMNLSTQQFKQAMEALSNQPLHEDPFTFGEIGLFSYIESSKSWIIIAKAEVS